MNHVYPQYLVFLWGIPIGVTIGFVVFIALFIYHRTKQRKNHE